MKQKSLKITLSALSLAVAFVMSGQVMAGGTCTTAAGGALDSITAGAPWATGGTGTGCAASTVAVPDNTNALTIGGGAGHTVTAPTAASISVASVAFNSGNLTLAFGKTLNVAGTFAATAGTTTINTGGILSVGGNLSFGPAPAGTIILAGGTLIAGANINLDDVTGTFNATTGTLKFTDTNHSFTLFSAQTFANVDVSLLTGATGAGKTITFLGGFNHIISNLIIPAAAPAAKEIKFVVPPNQTLTISAITGNTMACTTATAGATVGGSAAAPVFNAGTGGGGGTFSCITGITAAPSPVSAPVDLTESGKVTTMSKEITIK